MATHVRMVISIPSSQPATKQTKANQAGGAPHDGTHSQAWPQRIGWTSALRQSEPCCRARTEFSLPNLALQLLGCGIGRAMGPRRLVYRPSLSRDLVRICAGKIVVAMNIHRLGIPSSISMGTMMMGSDINKGQSRGLHATHVPSIITIKNNNNYPPHKRQFRQTTYIKTFK